MTKGWGGGLYRKSIQQHAAICCLYIFTNRVQCSCLLQILFGREKVNERKKSTQPSGETLYAWDPDVPCRNLMLRSGIRVPISHSAATVWHTHLHLRISELLFSSKCLVLVGLTFKKKAVSVLAPWEKVMKNGIYPMETNLICRVPMWEELVHCPIP